jgi:hypothetical protein
MPRVQFPLRNNAALDGSSAWAAQIDQKETLPGEVRFGPRKSGAIRALSASGHSRRFDRGPLTSGLPRSTDIITTLVGPVRANYGLMHRSNYRL